MNATADLVTPAVDKLSRMLLDSYTEVDEEVGPRIRRFELSERQLLQLGAQLTSLRDASTAQHAAHVELAKLTVDAADAEVPTVPSVTTFSAPQEGLARLSQHVATQYDRFVGISVNQLEGLALIVSNKYKAYCNKVVEVRRRKAQLQLLVKQKERSDLRTLERSLIPQGSTAFHADIEGTLQKQSATTRLWWSTYARLDVKRKCLLFTSRASDLPSAASKAVALSKYRLCHELPEHHARRPAAFELVPAQPELPVVTLSTDGTLNSRRWICAIQEAIDHVDTDETPEHASAAAGQAEDGPSAGSGGEPGPGAAATPTPPMPAPRGSLGTDTAIPSSLQPFASKLGEFVDWTSSKTDELDRRFSGTLAEQSHRTEVQLAQLGDEKTHAARGVVEALDEFHATLEAQMAAELLRITQAELEYHRGMAAHLEQLETKLKAGQAASPMALECSDPVSAGSASAWGTDATLEAAAASGPTPLVATTSHAQPGSAISASIAPEDESLPAASRSDLVLEGDEATKASDSVPPAPVAPSDRLGDEDADEIVD